MACVIKAWSKVLVSLKKELRAHDGNSYHYNTYDSAVILFVDGKIVWTGKGLSWSDPIEIKIEAGLGEWIPKDAKDKRVCPNASTELYLDALPFEKRYRMEFKNCLRFSVDGTMAGYDNIIRMSYAILLDFNMGEVR